jgi:hypothetical protein
MLVSAAAYAAIPTLAVSWTYDFSARTAGQNWEDGVDWGLSGDPGLAKVVSDGGNLVGQILPHTATGTHYSGVFMNQGLLPALGLVNYDLNVMQFKVKLPTGQQWDTWDKAVMAKWGMVADSGQGDFAYGSTIGTGFSIASELGVLKSQGSMGYGTSKAGGAYVAPGNAYHTSLDGITATTGTGAWHTMTMVMNRRSGVMDWYQDGSLFASKTLVQPASPPPAPTPTYSEWLWGNDWTIDGEARVMDYLEFGAWGRNQSTTSQILIDDIVAGGANIVPEPSSLIALSAFGLGALGFIRRRKA